MMAPESDSWYWKRRRLPLGLRPGGLHHVVAAAAVGAAAAAAARQSSRAAASVEAQELIGLRMRFKADVAADGNGHQRHLQIAPAPGD